MFLCVLSKCLDFFFGGWLPTTKIGFIASFEEPKGNVVVDTVEVNTLLH